MVLIEAVYCHYFAVVNRDGLHMQVLEWLFRYFRAFSREVAEQIRVEEALVAWLVSISCCNYLNFDPTFLHRFDQLIL